MASTSLWIKKAKILHKFQNEDKGYGSFYTRDKKNFEFEFLSLKDSWINYY